MDTGSKIITGFSAASAVISFFSQPIPILGSVLSISAQFGLAAALAKQNGQDLRELPWSDISLRALKTNVPLVLVDLTIGRIPVVGNITDAVVSYLSTRSLGRYVERTLPPEETAPASR